MTASARVRRFGWMGMALGVFATVAPWAPAASLTQGNILVSSTTNLQTNILREYTPTGQLVQTFSVPVAPGGDPFARGIATDTAGNVQIYNGTFTPYLTTLDPAGSGTFTNHTFSGWSTVNDTLFGGIVVNGNFAYATDMATVGGGPNGIVRFDLTNFSATRFASGTTNGSGDYIQLGLGLNGLLYAPWPGGSPQGDHIDIINPVSMTVVSTINLPFTFQVSGVTADQTGNIYAAGALDDGHIYKLDKNGNVLASIPTGFTNLTGLELSNSGQLLTASSTGEVIMTNTSFSSLTSFSVGAQITTFDAFVTPPTVASVPEPAGLTLMAVGLGFVASRVGRRRRPAGPVAR